MTVSIQVQANRFQQSGGNTYHKVYVTGSVLLESNIVYGYGDGWTMTLCDLLSDNGIIPKREGNRAPLRWIRENGVNIESESVNDVKSNRDL